MSSILTSSTDEEIEVDKEMEERRKARKICARNSVFYLGGTTGVAVKSSRCNGGGYLEFGKITNDDDDLEEIFEPYKDSIKLPYPLWKKFPNEMREVCGGKICECVYCDSDEWAKQFVDEEKDEQGPKKQFADEEENEQGPAKRFKFDDVGFKFDDDDDEDGESFSKLEMKNELLKLNKVWQFCMVNNIFYLGEYKGISVKGSSCADGAVVELGSYYPKSNSESCYRTERIKLQYPKWRMLMKYADELTKRFEEKVVKGRQIKNLQEPPFHCECMFCDTETWNCQYHEYNTLPCDCYLVGENCFKIAPLFAWYW